MGYANYARIEQSQSDIRGKNDCCMPTLMFDFATLISAFYEPEISFRHLCCFAVLILQIEFIFCFFCIHTSCKCTICIAFVMAGKG